MFRGGRIGTLGKTFDDGRPIYFSHNEFVCSAAHERVRLGMGALRRIFEVIFGGLTGGTVRGKPRYTPSANPRFRRPSLVTAYERLADN